MTCERVFQRTACDGNEQVCPSGSHKNSLMASRRQTVEDAAAEE